ncbi:MAG: CHASE2 domain-containing protein [Hyphomicrobium sp.]|uniref:CHASE2 domain-containing protein n=1 Tax=Hyphomicrobium sp. TaxID=82 RepID=UPI003D0C5CEA
MTRAAGDALPRRFAIIAGLLIFGIVAAYLSLRDSPLATAIEGQSLGWRFELRGALPPPPSVVIVAIDDATLAALQRWPLPRRVLADAVNRLTRAGAAVVGLDLLLLDREAPGDGAGLGPGDSALLEALAATDRDLLVCAFTHDADGVPDPASLAAAREAGFRVVHRPEGELARDVAATGLLVPIEPFRRVSGLGHVNVPVDPDGVLRRLPLAIALGEAWLPAFPLEAARRFLGLRVEEMVLRLDDGVSLGARRIATGPALRLPIDYYGPAGTLATYSLLDLLEGRVPEAAIRGRAVILGPTAIGVGDTFSAPFSRVMPGIEVLGTVVGNLLDGPLLDRRTGESGWDVSAIALAGLATFLLAGRLPPIAGAIAAGLLLLGWWAIAYYAFARHALWLDVTFPSAAILLVALLGVIARASLERRQRRNLAGYHAPALVDLLAAGGGASLDGRSQQAAILFVDLAGSTTRLERMTPDETVRFLRELHGRIERAVLAHGGVLEQFMGDGAMVMFGVPKPSPGDPAAALAAAIDLEADIARWNETLAAAGGMAIDLRVGIHYGPIAFARVGGAKQAQVTAAGDTVNVASRIEAMTRDEEARIAISGAVVEGVRAAGRASLLAGFVELPLQRIRGREGRMSIWIKRGRGPAAA